MTPIPAVEMYRGVGIHDYQPAERVNRVVKPAIDRVFAISAPADLYRYACDKTHPPEARLLAAARYRALHEARAGTHDTRPGRLEQLKAEIAGLNSLEWVDVHFYGTGLEPRSPGPETRVPRPPECRTGWSVRGMHPGEPKRGPLFFLRTANGSAYRSPARTRCDSAPAPMADARLGKQREYQRQYRLRQRRGIAMLRIPVSPDVIEALLVAGRLDDAGSRDDKKVAEALAAVQRQWAKEWLAQQNR